MEWGWEIFYGLCTALAAGLSLRRGGAVARAVCLMAACWLAQGLIYWLRSAWIGNYSGLLFDAALLILFFVFFHGYAWRWVIIAVLGLQLYIQFAYRTGDIDSVTADVMSNILYLVRLYAPLWPEDRKGV
jgi:hypothetical protein